MTQDSPLVKFDSTELSNRFELQLQGISVERKINPGAYHLSLCASGEHWNLGFHREEIRVLYM
jgi:hypothetical protein